MDQIVLCDKSFQERFQEYVDILTGYEIQQLSLSHLKKIWSVHLEQSVDPMGWQAIWKIPRITCERLEISFPTLVLVYVKHVEYTQHTAIVKVWSSNADIDLSQEYHVSLVELFATKEQDKTLMLDLHLTASTVDALRFFYNHLYMPWENEKTDTATWVHEVLKERLLLYYNMKNGLVSPAVAERLQYLYTEAKRLEVKIENLYEKFGGSAEHLDIHSTEAEVISEVQVCLQEIRNEVELLEDSKSREFVIKERKCARNNPHYWIVTNKTTSTECIDLIERIKSYYPGIVCRFVLPFSTIFHVIQENDAVILGKGMHSVFQSEVLDVDLTFKALYEKFETVIKTQADNVMLNINSDVTFENLTIHAASAQCGILVSSGKLKLINCNIIGDGIASSTHQGFIVLPNSFLELINCTVTGFATAIVMNSNSTLVLESSEISDVNLGIKMYGNSSVHFEKVLFEDCRDYGISLETDIEDGEDHCGNFEILKQ